MHPSWIGPGRTNATWTIRSSSVSGRLRGSICICARLSIWNTPVVSAARIASKVGGSSSGIRERSICSSRASATARRSARRRRASRGRAGRSSGTRRLRRSPCPTGRSAAPPSPPAGPGRVDQRAGRAHHPARVLGEVAWRPHACGASRAGRRHRGEAARPAPIASAMSRSTSSPREYTSATPRPARSPRRQPQRLAEIPHRAPRAVAGEGRDQRRPLAAVALVDPGINRSRMSRGKSRSMSGISEISSLRKRPKKRPARTGSTCESPVRMADDRGNARAAPAAGQERAAGGVRAPDLRRHIPRQLEQVEVEEEEPREPQPADHPQLLLEPALGLRTLQGALVAELEAAAADLGQGAVGLRVLSSRVAVAELAGRGRSATAPDALSRRPPPGGLRAGRHLLRRREHRAGVAAPGGSHSSSVVCRRTATNASWSSARRRSWAWTLPVATSPPRAARRAGRGAGCEPGRDARTAAAARPGSSRPKPPTRRRASASARRASPRSQARGEGAVAGAAREADQALASLEQRAEAEHGGGITAGVGPGRACASVSRRPGVAPAGRVGDQEGEVEGGPGPVVRLVGDRELGADDRSDPDPRQAWANSIARRRGR